jgi:hypothetical protein
MQRQIAQWKSSAVAWLWLTGYRFGASWLQVHSPSLTSLPFFFTAKSRKQATEAFHQCPYYKQFWQHSE